MEPNLDVQLMNLAQQQADNYPVDADLMAECSKALSRADILLKRLTPFMATHLFTPKDAFEETEIQEIRQLLREWNEKYG